MNKFSFLVDGAQTMAANPKVPVTWVVRALLIWLAIKKDFRLALLLPMGFGTILVNLPLPDVLGNIVIDAVGHTTIEGAPGIVTWLFQASIETSEAFPLLLFAGIGMMIGFGPPLSNPRMLLLSDAAQFDTFLTIVLAVLLGPPLEDAMSIGVIGAADGPTSILTSQTLGSAHMDAIAVAAYSYMALVPVIRLLAIKLVTNKKERIIHMPYNPRSVTKTAKILFPTIVTLTAGMIVLGSVALVDFLIFDSLTCESDRLESLPQTTQGLLANLIAIFLGITVAFIVQADRFLNVGTLIVMALGLFAFTFDIIGGVLFAKVLNIFLPQSEKINPIVGSAGISAFPVSSRVIQKMALEENNQGHLLMHAVGANVAGQIDSVVAGGIILSLAEVFLT